MNLYINIWTNIPTTAAEKKWYLRYLKMSHGTIPQHPAASRIVSLYPLDPVPAPGTPDHPASADGFSPR